MRLVHGRQDKLLLILLISLTSHAAFSKSDYKALEPEIVANSSFFSYLAALSAGPVWESAGRTQTLNLAPGIEKTYAAKQPTNALFNGEVFLGIQMPLCHKLQVQAGLAVAATASATLSGNIWDDANPAFNNYTYHYQVSHTHIALKGKLLADWDYFVIPWLSGSIGVGFNHSHNFKSTPSIVEAVPTPGFSSHTTTSFTYTIGAGIQHALTENLQAGIGYEFADWGHSRLGRAPGQTLGGGLSLSHLYTNGLLLNMIYVS